MNGMPVPPERPRFNPLPPPIPNPEEPSRPQSGGRVGVVAVFALVFLAVLVFFARTPDGGRYVEWLMPPSYRGQDGARAAIGFAVLALFVVSLLAIVKRGK